MTYVVALYLSQSSESSMLNLTYLTPQRCLGGACGRLSGLDDRPRHLHTHRPLMPPQVHLMIMLKRIMWEFHTYCSICRYIRFRNSGCWFYFVLCRETRRFSKRLQRAGGRDEVSFENQKFSEEASTNQNGPGGWDGGAWLNARTVCCTEAWKGPI